MFSYVVVKCASAYGIQIVDNTDQIVREYQGLYSVTPLDHESSSATVARSESYLDASTSNYHLEISLPECADLEFNLSRSAVLDQNIPYVATNPITTAQSQGLANSGRLFQSTSHSLSRPSQSNQGSASLASTFASSSLLNRAVDLNIPSEVEAELPVSNVQQTRLIRAYLQETGTWCEATDSGRHFTVSYIHKLLENKPFAAAAMALASRQLDAVGHSQRQSTSNLYQHAVRSLFHYEPSQCGTATLATCTILSIYEMMASEVCEWRRHLKVSLSGKIGELLMLTSFYRDVSKICCLRVGTALIQD
jgi:hypothetical protein